MPTTRKRIIKTVYKDDEDSEQDGHDFSDSGSDAVISEQSSSEDEEEVIHKKNQESSDDDFVSTKPKTVRRNVKKRNNPVTKSFITKVTKQKADVEENIDVAPALFSVKDLTDADKLLPSILNLSESDSSDDETSKVSTKKKIPAMTAIGETVEDSESNVDTKHEYQDVWSANLHNESAELAKKTFIELEQHKSKIEETKMSIQNYTIKKESEQKEYDIKDLLALGEEELPKPSPSRKKKKTVKEESDSEMEDWEEVKEEKGIPQQGLQLIVDIPDCVSRKTKKIDVEMMMKRKINRVKKEYQVYMHKVHVLCWLGHGNYVSRVLNDLKIMAAALSLVPSKECYPRERVDLKYIEQITSWFKDKVTLKQDKNENKFKPKAPPLNEILSQQIQRRVFTTKKYIVFVFVSMLRSLGLQCRVMFNFVTLPIKPPSFELCSLSTKPKEVKTETKKTGEQGDKPKPKVSPKKPTKDKKGKATIPQLDGNYDMSSCSDSENIMQVDGNDDGVSARSRREKPAVPNTKKHPSSDADLDKGDVSPPKRSRRTRTTQLKGNVNQTTVQKSNEIESTNLSTPNSTKPKASRKSLSLNRLQSDTSKETKTSDEPIKNNVELSVKPKVSRSAKNSKNTDDAETISKPNCPIRSKRKVNNNLPKGTPNTAPEIVVTDENNEVASKFFQDDIPPSKKLNTNTRTRSKTEPKTTSKEKIEQEKRTRTKTAESSTESKYFSGNIDKEATKRSRTSKKQVEASSVDNKRVSHKDLMQKSKPKNDVTGDLVNIVKKRIKEAKSDTRSSVAKGKIKKESDEDSDYLPVESPKPRKSESDDDFMPATKISPKPRVGVKKVDRRVLSTDDEQTQNFNKIDVWCEVFVEELEEWVAVDVIKGSVHCLNEVHSLYSRATLPVAYVVGWDNNNYLKDLTRKYVPHWNTVTRKQRVEPLWWEQSVKPWLGPKTARDREEDERLNRMQLEAPLPKSIAEYKNHPLYALKRHLLKYEALYPPDAVTLGFVRGEAVYARDCVYVCRSRDTWLKEAKVVRLGEQPYKIVKARPKWDKLSNKVITDKPLEVFGPWQVQDYEPPTAENGIVPRNAYGNVELFKECMLPKGTVHLKLPSLNRVAKKLNIDCAPAMTGFDFNGGWSHPVYDGFVVCKEFEEILTEAWIKDQEDQERREIEKMEARVYGNWRKLIRGLLIKERLKAKYGFEEPSTSQDKKKKGPKFVAKKK